MDDQWYSEIKQEYFDALDDLIASKFHNLKIALFDLLIAIVESVRGFSRITLAIVAALGAIGFVVAGDFGMIMFSLGLILGMFSANREKLKREKLKNEESEILPGAIIYDVAKIMNDGEEG
jgi:hypothetical protein